MNPVDHSSLTLEGKMSVPFTLSRINSGDIF